MVIFSHVLTFCTSSQIMRDPETGNSRGFGFVSYDSFEASDAAIEVLSVLFPHLLLDVTYYRMDKWSVCTGSV